MSNTIETEQQYLGCLMLMGFREMNPHDISSACNGLQPDDFMTPQNRAIFNSIKNRSDRGQSFENILIIEDCKDEVSHTYVFEIFKNAVSTANVSEYKRIVKSNSVRRQALQSLNVIADMLHTSETPQRALGEAETIIQTLMGKASVDSGSFTHISQILTGYVNELEKRLAGDKETMGLTTSMPTIDEYLDGGIQPGSLVVMGGRAGSGKTSMMLSLIKGFAREMKTRSALAFSMEMSNLQLAKRYVSSHTGASYNRMVHELQNDPDETMWAKIFKLVGDDQNLPIYIADSSKLSVEQVCADVRQHARDNRVGLIAIDYLGLMDMPSADRHDLSIAKVTRALKLLAMELSCVVLLLSQVNRGVEKRDNKRPIASDFANSGAIENDADYVVTLYRDNYYNEDSMMGEIGEVNFVKNRHGEPFRVFMNFTSGNWIDNCNQAEAYNLMTQSMSRPSYKSEPKPYAGGGI